MSSKGQIVIPVAMRKGIRTGEKIMLIEGKDQIILKRANKMEQKMAEDFKFANRIEEAWKSYDRGEFKSMPFDKFLERLKKL